MTASRSNRVAQALLLLAGFFVGLVLAFIVIKSLLTDVSGLTKEQRKLDREEAPVEYVRIPGIGRVAYQFLFEEISEPGESLDSFARRIGPRLRAYSDATGFEACGVIGTNGAHYSVIVGTNFGYMVCVNSAAFVLDGYSHAGATIHSHGKQGRFRPTKTDLLLMGETFAGGRPSLAVVHGQALNTFSDADRRSGAGYLAGENGRLFFQGNGAMKEVTPP